MKIAVEIDLGKVLAVLAMVLCVWLSILCGQGEVLFLIVPATICYVLGLWKENDNG